MVVGYVVGNLASVITLKNEYNEMKMNKLNNEILPTDSAIREGNAELAKIKQSVTEELIKKAALISEKTKQTKNILNI